MVALEDSGKTAVATAVAMAVVMATSSSTDGMMGPSVVHGDGDIVQNQ